MKVGHKEIEAPPWKYKRRCEDVKEKCVTQAKTLRERLMIKEAEAMGKLSNRHNKQLDAFGMRVENFTDRSGKKFLRMVIGRNKNLEND